MGTITRTFANQIKTGGKLDADGLDLTDTFAFTGTVTGAGGITEADQWRITTNYNKSGTGTADITANWERNDNDFSLIGTGMTESSGIFSFPTTGIYLIMPQASMVSDSGGRLYMGFNIESTTNNSTYSAINQGYESTGTSGYYGFASCPAIFDVTDISTHKVKMKVSVADSVIFEGDTNTMKTGITFIRLGDT